MELFNEIFPAFHYLGECKHIEPGIAFDVEGEVNVKLVCQYLKAKKHKRLDYWHRSGIYYNLIGELQPPYMIANIIGDMSSKECQDTLNECLPDDVKGTKMILSLYLK